MAGRSYHRRNLSQRIRKVYPKKVLLSDAREHSCYFIYLYVDPGRFHKKTKTLASADPQPCHHLFFNGCCNLRTHQPLQGTSHLFSNGKTVLRPGGPCPLFSTKRNKTLFWISHRPKRRLLTKFLILCNRPSIPGVIQESGAAKKAPRFLFRRSRRRSSSTQRVGRCRRNKKRWLPDAGRTGS